MDSVKIFGQLTKLQLLLDNRNPQFEFVLIKVKPWINHQT